MNCLQTLVPRTPQPTTAHPGETNVSEKLIANEHLSRDRMKQKSFVASAGILENQNCCDIVFATGVKWHWLSPNGSSDGRSRIVERYRLQFHFFFASVPLRRTHIQFIPANTSSQVTNTPTLPCSMTLAGGFDGI